MHPRERGRGGAGLIQVKCDCLREKFRLDVHLPQFVF